MRALTGEKGQRVDSSLKRNFEKAASLQRSEMSIDTGSPKNFALLGAKHRKGPDGPAKTLRSYGAPGQQSIIKL